MTIAQALKEKNKKIAKIQKLWIRVHAHNAIEANEGIVRPYDIVATHAEWEAEIGQLVDLKHAIHTASQPVRKDIFAISELKGMTKAVRALNTNPAIYANRYSGGDARVKVEVTLDVAWQDKMIDSLEAKIEEIQERLDKFNHSTQI